MEQKAGLSKDMCDNKLVDTPVVVPFGDGPMTEDLYYYRESGIITDYSRTDLQRRISNYFYNNTSSNATQSLQCSTSQGYTINITPLSFKISSAITATIGGSWTASHSYSESASITVKPGQKGWFEWYPIMKNSFGYTDVYDWLGTTLKKHIWTDIYMTKKLANGKADGVLLGYTAAQ